MAERTIENTTEEKTAKAPIDKAKRQEERLEEAVAAVKGLKQYHGNVGLSFPASVVTNVPTRNMDQNSPYYGDFFSKKKELAVDGNVLTKVVDRMVREGTIENGNEIRWPKVGKDETPRKGDKAWSDPNVQVGENGERRVVRGEDGKFPSFTFPTKDKMKQPVLQDAAWKTLYSAPTQEARGRQFLLDTKNVELFQNTERSAERGGEVKARQVSGVEALIQPVGSKDFRTFVKVDDLVNRMREEPRVAPYIAAAVVEANGRYVENVQNRANTKDKNTGVER